MKKDDTYNLKVYCRNCGVRSSIEIKKGVLIDETMTGRVMIENKCVECPNCGCYELKRDR